MNPEPKSEIILYQTEDNRTRIEVRLENETVWLTQNQMAELFQTSIPNVSMHIRTISLTIRSCSQRRLLKNS